MSTFYLDLVGGNDANDGTTFANRWLTTASGATAARIAPGDTIRVMASADPTLLDTGAVWTANSKTLTLSGAVTSNINDCETAWTASANVTSTADATLFKENTKSAKHVIASAFTTGLVAYGLTGVAANYSSYQQVSFWFYNTAAIAASTLSIRLCSDTVGAVSVTTIAIPAVPSSNRWVAITVDTGGALAAAVSSVALYADLDPGTVTIQLDNIIACKASSSADSLSLTSLVGKVHNLYWVASTSYAQNDIRKPTPPNRNGYRYKKQNSGSHTSSGSEPTWPQEIGATVSDGSITWVCDGLEDTWFPIQSISGTTVKIDSGTQAQGSAGRGYSGATETLATYKRENIKMTMVTSASTLLNAIQDSGSASGGQITFTGGWNTTDMSTQTGETWISGQNGLGYAWGQNSKTNVTFENLNAVAIDRVLNIDANQYIIKNCHGTQLTTSGCNTSGNSVGTITGVHFANNAGSNCLNTAATGPCTIRAFTGNSSGSMGINHSGLELKGIDFVCKNNGSSGVSNSSSTSSPVTIYGLIGGSNVSSDANTQLGSLYLINSSVPVGVSAGTTNRDVYLFSHKNGQVADTHVITTDGGTISSTTAQRHTASGIAWLFSPTATNRASNYPLRLKIGTIAVNASALVTMSIWTRRDSTNISGQLIVPGGQISGVPTDVTVSCAPSINTWTQSSNLTFTPTEIGAIEVWFYAWDGTGTTNSFYIDDFAVSQA